MGGQWLARAVRRPELLVDRSVRPRGRRLPHHGGPRGPRRRERAGAHVEIRRRLQTRARGRDGRGRRSLRDAAGALRVRAARRRRETRRRAAHGGQQSRVPLPPLAAVPQQAPLRRGRGPPALPLAGRAARGARASDESRVFKQQNRRAARPAERRAAPPELLRPPRRSRRRPRRRARVEPLREDARGARGARRRRRENGRRPPRGITSERQRPARGLTRGVRRLLDVFFSSGRPRVARRAVRALGAPAVLLLLRRRRGGGPRGVG
mmetsp:Transcript_16982/g.52922  ORF Transcript_16982/g.52922 Transcript_16982/m.52922 type:complete len:266 (+) Transcript_16982:1692-2489(+)